MKSFCSLIAWMYFCSVSFSIQASILSYDLHEIQMLEPTQFPSDEDREEVIILIPEVWEDERLIKSFVYSLKFLDKKTRGSFFFNGMQIIYIVKNTEEDEDTDDGEDTSDKTQGDESSDTDASSRISELEKLSIQDLRVIGRDRLIDFVLSGKKH